jgi:hypothetical protein
MSDISITTAEQPPDGRVAPSRGRTYAQLIRLPALFTALADIFLGYALTHRDIGDAPLVLGLLLVASAGLYLAGMVFNDLFDAVLDAVERPERPIPSGRVSRASAIRLGCALVITGLAAAVALRWVDPLLCGWNPAFVAALITAAVFLYDGFLKRTPLGPLGMGLCRFLNVCLGASASGFLFGRPFDNPQRSIAIGLGIYIIGVTWFARTEERTSRRSSLVGGLVTVNLGLAALLAWIQWRGPEETRLMGLLLLGLIALSLNKRMLVAVTQPSPVQVQFAVRTLLMSIITIDCAMIFAKSGNILVASGIAIGLVVPTLLTGRLMRMT